MIDLAPIRAAAHTIASRRITALRDKDGVISIVLDVTGMSPKARDAAEQALTTVIRGQPGVSAVRVAMTADKPQRRIIAVASGKGGVGKSTISTNLAVALARSGRKVGLVDADIYGPSQPVLLGTGHGKPEADSQTKKLLPVRSPWGVTMLSMGQLAKPEQAIAWRGPMASGALGQLIDAEWGNADTLIVDMPPGTGDIQLTMVQKYKPSGAVIVTTPQDLSLIDARRAIALFQQVDVPIIGIVENMAGYLCPHCQKESTPFGSGGGEAAAAELNVPFLGRIPLALTIRESSDAGIPPAAGNDAAGEPFQALATRVSAWLDRNSKGPLYADHR